MFFKPKMKHIFFLSVSVLTGTIFFLLYSELTVSNNPFSRKECESIASYTGTEIIIMWDQSLEMSETAKIISKFPQLTIIEQYDDYMLCDAKDNSHLYDLLCKLKQLPEVVTVQPNYEITIMSAGITNDYYSDSQWSLNNNGQYTHIIGSTGGITFSTEDIDINAPEAWSVLNKDSLELRETIVAIIDTGVDYKHPDLTENMWINPNEIPGDGIDNDNNDYIDDIYGWDFYNGDNTVCHYEFNSRLNAELSSHEDDDNHGTHIAGIIGAVSDNSIGIAGVASNVPVKLMSLKIHGGPKGSGTISDAIKAIRYATAAGADICNISWGSAAYSSALEQVIRESDMLFVVAAGNDGANNNSLPVYPANFDLDNLISVTFIDPNGNLTLDSNYGVSTVDIAAPGMDIYSTVVGTYTSMSGSSMAVPHVVGVAAMLYSYSDNLYAKNIKEIIVNNIKTLDSLSGVIINPGIPDAYAAVSAVDSLARDFEAPIISASTSFDKEYVVVNLNVDEFGGSGLRTLKYMIGTRTLSDFRRGVRGTNIYNFRLSLSRTGIYTFYASDYSGNESIIVYTVIGDTTAPELTYYYDASPNRELYTIYGFASDSESGLKQIKYVEGLFETSDFLSGTLGEVVETENGHFKLHLPQGSFSLYLTDYRGNKTVNTIELHSQPIQSLSFAEDTLILSVGSVHSLTPQLQPEAATSQIYFKSSDTRILSVNKYGVITALSMGIADVTASTADGISAKCTIIVLPQAPEQPDSREEDSPENGNEEVPDDNSEEENLEET